MFLKTFCLKRNKTSYHEVLADSNLFEKFYEIDNPYNVECIAIPDGSVDIQCFWKGNAMNVYVAGSYREGGISKITEYDKCFGARFHTGILPMSLNGDIGKIINNRILLDSYFEIPGLKEKVKMDLLLEQKADCMLDLFRDVEVPKENMIIRFLIDEIKKNSGHVVVGDMIENLGYSHRYSDYVFKSTTGFSIKKYASIIRLQESIKCIMEKKEDNVYDKLGYYDQSHFIHDFKRFTSLTPNLLKKNAEEIEIV